MNTGHLVLTIIFTSAMALYIAGAATAWVTTDISGTQTKSTFWTTCTTKSDTTTCATIADATCADLQKTIDAGKSFGIITTVLGGLVAVVAGLRLWKSDLVTGTLRVFWIIFVLLALTAACLQWIISFAAYASTFCDFKYRDLSFANAGPQGPLFFVGFCLSFVGLIFEFIWGGAPEAAAAADTKTQPATA